MVKPITIITPCHNENTALIQFLDQLQENLRTLNFRFRVVVVDDYSTDNSLDLLNQYSFSATNIRLHVLRLKFNVGHQGAIYQGLVYSSGLHSDLFIIMDSDGEDDPHAIPELLRHSDKDIVHVVRGKRSESILFRASYRIYRGIFKWITGSKMNFGNYTLINRRMMEAAIYSGFSHFAAFLSKQKGSREYIVYDRVKRIGGESKMNFDSLIHHAFRSLVEYGESMLMLFLKFFVIIILLFIAALSNILYQKFVSHTAILGWTSVTAIGLLNMAIISIGFFILGVLLLNINNRKNQHQGAPIYEDLTKQTGDGLF